MIIFYYSVLCIPSNVDTIAATHSEGCKCLGTSSINECGASQYCYYVDANTNVCSDNPRKFLHYFFYDKYLYSYTSDQGI